MTYRREATGKCFQLGFTDNDNVWLRGNSGGNLYMVTGTRCGLHFHGAGSGLDAEKLDNHQGLLGSIWFLTSVLLKVVSQKTYG
ncbi:MAG: hypothetical protein CM15mV22_1730 [Eurybiavirus sp.]|nr:MAG: hypothetical protein CM15mV22_1730 [Eurybiavirus sp.]